MRRRGCDPAVYRASLPFGLGRPCNTAFHSLVRRAGKTRGICRCLLSRIVCAKRVWCCSGVHGESKPGAVLIDDFDAGGQPRRPGGAAPAPKGRGTLRGRPRRAEEGGPAVSHVSAALTSGGAYKVILPNLANSVVDGPASCSPSASARRDAYI